MPSFGPEPFFSLTIPAGSVDDGTDADNDDDDAVDTTRFVIAAVVVNKFVAVVFLAEPALCRDDAVVWFGSFRPLPTDTRPPCPPPAGAAVVFVIIVGTVVAVAAAAPTSVVVLSSSGEDARVV